MSAVLSKLVTDLADALERHTPSDPLIPYARGVLAGVQSLPAKAGRTSGWRKQATDQDRAIAADYEGGLTVEKVAVKHGVVSATVRAAVNRCGGTMRTARHRGPADPRSDQFWNEYQSGKTLEQIGAANHITRQRVRQILVKGGYDIKAANRPVPEAHQKAIAAYLAGDSLQTVASVADVSVWTMRNILIRNGHAIRTPNRRRFDAAKAAHIAALYQSGKAVQEIGDAMGFSGQHVYRWLGYAGVKPSRKRRPNVDTAS